jgi:Uma2 family endonuclease
MAEPARKPSALDDPFRFGSRLARVRLANGRVEVREIPLTADDLLEAQVGDQVSQNSWHVDTALMLCDVVRRRYEPHVDVFVTSDMKMIWEIPGLPGPAPDLAVIPGVRNRERYRESFDVRVEGVRPCLVAEIVSNDPEARRRDYVDKVAIYERAGVPEYLIIDPPFVPREGRCRFAIYRLSPAGEYERVGQDLSGGVFSLTTGLWFGPSPDGQRVEVFDSSPRIRLLTASEEAGARRAAEAEVERLERELERLRRLVSP